MKPFSLTDALNKKPVVTRDGRPVTDIHYFPNVFKQPVAAVVNSRLLTFTESGHFYDGNNPVDNDLFMAETKREGWINIYKKSDTQEHLAAYTAYDGIHPTHVFRTKKDADDHAGQYPRIACVRIEWEE